LNVKIKTTPSHFGGRTLSRNSNFAYQYRLSIKTHMGSVVRKKTQSDEALHCKASSAVVRICICFPIRREKTWVVFKKCKFCIPTTQIFGRKVWNSTDERLRRIIWRCNGKYPVKGEKGCESKHIDVFNTLVENKDYFLDKWKGLRESDNPLQRYKAKQFSKIITETGQIEEFDIDLYFALTEKVVVYDEGRLTMDLLDGSEVECLIE